MDKNKITDIAHFKLQKKDFLMAFKRKPMLYFSVSFLISCSMTGGIAYAMYKHIVNQDSYVPPLIISRLDGNAVKSCYPTIYGEPLSVKKIPNETGITYWEILVSEPSGGNKNLWFQTAKKTDGSPTCFWMNRMKDGERLSFLPESVAKQFALQHYRNVFSDCLEVNLNFRKEDKDLFCKRSIEETLLKSKETYYLEDKLALTEMGVNTTRLKFSLPKKVQNDFSSAY